jgi:ribosomal protein S27AE
MSQCPECGAKIIWGLPDLERLDSEPCGPGDVVVAGSFLGEENHCPRCGALVFTAAEALA